MRFKVEGVSAENGKKIAPRELVADDQREAATMAKSLKILPTRITPITDLLTIGASQGECDEATKPRRTTLISIDGHPKWFVATLVLALLITSVWIFGGNRNPDTEVIVPDSNSTIGLGWSLQNFERGLPAEDGWYWSEKARPEVGTGIKYIAENAAYPWVAIQLIGSPTDLHTFRLAAVIGNDEYLTTDEQTSRFKEACLLAGVIIDDDTDSFAHWAGINVGLSVLDPQTPVSASKVWNGRLASLSIESQEGGQRLLISITATE